MSYRVKVIWRSFINSYVTSVRVMLGYSEIGFRWIVKTICISSFKIIPQHCLETTKKFCCSETGLEVGTFHVWETGRPNTCCQKMKWYVVGRHGKEQDIPMTKKEDQKTGVNWQRSLKQNRRKTKGCKTMADCTRSSLRYLQIRVFFSSLAVRCDCPCGTATTNVPVSYRLNYR